MLLPRASLRSYRERIDDHTESVKAFLPRAQRRSYRERHPLSEEMDTERVTFDLGSPPDRSLAGTPCPNQIFLTFEVLGGPLPHRVIYGEVHTPYLYEYEHSPSIDPLYYHQCG